MKKEKVSIGWQVGILLIGVIIPFVWLYPFYKIQKLTYGVIISIGLTVLAFAPFLISVQIDSTVGGWLFFILYFAKIPILFYVLIRWSREWNAKFDSGMNEN